MKNLQQLSLFVENRPGALSEVFSVLKDNGISVLALALADTQQFGILRLMTARNDEARKVLEAAGFVVKSTEVLALSITDRPGALAELLAVFDRHQLPVEYLYTFAAARAGRTEFVFRFSDPERALRELASEPVEVISEADLTGR